MNALLDAAEGRVAPAVSALVLRDGVEVYARAPERVYDLASLTKPLCTAELALRAVDAGGLELDGGSPLLPAGVTVRHLLQHGAGYPAWRRLWTLPDRAAMLAAAAETPLQHAPGTAHVYSDVGFLALGRLIEAVGGARLDALLAPYLGGLLTWGDSRAEPTWCDERSAAVHGTVHDRNAAAMGGVAPHAGLFGTARGVAACAMRWLDGRVPASAEAFVCRGPGTHVLGWDTPSPGGASSAGERPPEGLVGHLGFTGTALWIWPARRVVAVLLTNRIAQRAPGESAATAPSAPAPDGLERPTPGPDTAPIRALRRAFFQAVWDGEG